MAVAGTPVMLRGREVLKIEDEGERKAYFYRGFIVTTDLWGKDVCFRPVEGGEEALQYVIDRVGGRRDAHYLPEGKRGRKWTGCILPPRGKGDSTETALDLIDSFWESELRGRIES